MISESILAEQKKAIDDMKLYKSNENPYHNAVDLMYRDFFLSDFEKAMRRRLIRCFSEWFEFINRYRGSFKDLTGYLKIPRERFNKIDEAIALMNLFSPTEIKGIHKALLFSIYVLLNVISIQKSNPLSIEETKQILGYNKKTDSIDKFLKDGGLFDEYGITKTFTRGLKGSKRQAGERKRNYIKYKFLSKEWRELSYDWNSGNFIQLKMPVFLYILFHINEIGTIGLYLYCFLHSKSFIDGEKPKRFKFSMERMIIETGLSKGTVEKYADILERYGLIEIIRGKINYDEFDEFESKEVNEYLVISELNENCVFNKI